MDGELTDGKSVIAWMSKWGYMRIIPVHVCVDSVSKKSSVRYNFSSQLTPQPQPLPFAYNVLARPILHIQV